MPGSNQVNRHRNSSGRLCRRLQRDVFTIILGIGDFWCIFGTPVVVNRLECIFNSGVLLQDFQHRERLIAPMLGGDMTGNEHEGNERAPPKHAAQIEAGDAAARLQIGNRSGASGRSEK